MRQEMQACCNTFKYKEGSSVKLVLVRPRTDKSFCLGILSAKKKVLTSLEGR